MTDAAAFEDCVARGGVALFPSDTVYGLACDPLNARAVHRLYQLKGRRLDKPSSVMFFGVDLALEALPELGERTRTALVRLLPGGVTLLLLNPAGRFPLACGEDRRSLGIRVPQLDWAAGIRRPVLQSSANLAGGADPVRTEDVPHLISSSVDLVLDAGELPGTSSTVVDLRAYEQERSWSVIRSGPVTEGELEQRLGKSGLG